MTNLKIKVLLSFVVTFFIFLSVLNINYETNDDPLMMFIASGALTGSPDEHLQCIHILPGLLLKHLYLLMPGVPWYGVLLVTVNLSSLLLIIVSVMYGRHISVTGLIVFVLVIMLGYEALFLVKLQFTAIAFVAGFAGIFCLYSRMPWPCRLTGFLVFMSVAFLLRRETFLPLAGFAGLALLDQYVRKQFTLRKAALALILSASLFTVSWYINDRDSAYRASGYYPYHRATDIICNLPIDTSGNLLDKYDWTPNDLALLGFWFWVDEAVYTPAKITGFASDAKTYRPARETISYAVSLVREEQFAVLVVLLSMLIIFFTPGFSKTDRWFAGLNLVLTAALLMYLIIMARAPKRVSTPILFYMAAFAMYLIVQNRARNNIRTGLMILLLLVSGYKFWCVWQFSQQKKQVPGVFAQAVRHINQHPEDLYVVVSKGLPFDQMPVFQQAHNLFPHKNLFIAGWLTHLPAYNSLLEIHGLKNLSSDLIGRENIVLLNGNIRVRQILTEFYRQHYGIPVSFVPYSPAIPNLPSYRFVFEEDPDAVSISQR